MLLGHLDGQVVQFGEPFGDVVGEVSEAGECVDWFGHDEAVEVLVVMRVR